MTVFQVTDRPNRVFWSKIKIKMLSYWQPCIENNRYRMIFSPVQTDRAVTRNNNRIGFVLDLFFPDLQLIYNNNNIVSNLNKHRGDVVYIFFFSSSREPANYTVTIPIRGQFIGRSSRLLPRSDDFINNNLFNKYKTVNKKKFI